MVKPSDGDHRGSYYHIKAKCQVVKVITIQVIIIEIESYFIITGFFLI